MVLTEKEKTTIKDLQTQEELCIEKYGKYANEATDSVLKALFSTIQQEEQKHYQSLGEVLNGQVPSCDCNDSKGKMYTPTASY
ncbi:MAG: ferritin-like domain-containing protein, partial [Niameybacter sp.]